MQEQNPGQVGESSSRPSPIVGVGRAIYPYRGAFGVPLLVAVLLFCHPRAYSVPGLEPLRSLLGWAVLMVGLGIRTWGVACWFTRDGDGVIGGRRLMTEDGPYAFTRNPRYLGNLGMGVGAAILSGIPEAVLFFVSLWCAVHYPIIVAETETLRVRFGDTFDEYRSRVPAFWPQGDGRHGLLGQLLRPNWAAGILEEMGTLTGWTCLGLLVEWWRASHLVGFGFGWHWFFLLLVPVVLGAGQVARARLRVERFAADDRPLAP